MPAMMPMPPEAQIPAPPGAEMGGGGMDLAGLMGQIGAGAGAQPGASTDPQAILQQLAMMAESDQAQLEMQQAIEQQQLEAEQKQAMIVALQAMIQQLQADAHVLGGAEAAAAPAEAMGQSDAMSAEDLQAELPPGITRASGQPIPDQHDIPAY